MTPPQRQISVVNGENGLVITHVRITAYADRLDVTITDPDVALPQVVETVKSETNNLTQAMTLDERVSRVMAAVTARLRADSFEVEEVPVGDQALSFEIDIKSGMLVGRSQSMVSQGTVGPPRLERAIQLALADGFAQGGIDLAAEIQALVAIGEHSSAAKAVAEGLTRGVFAVRNPTLLEMLWAIDANAVPIEQREALWQTRSAVSAHHRRYDLAEADARALLAQGTDLTPSKRVDLENVIAVAANARGETEIALSIWRRLLRTSDALDAGTRAWIWRNLSLALPLTSAEASRAAKLSADAFLEAGEKHEAVTSLMRLVDLLKQQKPSDIIVQLDVALALVDQRGLIGDELRAAAYHLRGNRFGELGRHQDALAAAREAIRLRDGVLGVEEQLISSLHLATFEARAAGDPEAAASYEAKAKNLETEIASPYFALARQIASLFTDFSAEKATEFLSGAEATGEPRLIGAAGVASAMSDPSLDDEARLGRLEALHGQLGRMAAKNDDLHAVQLALATVLRRLGQHDRAAIWLRRILATHPLDSAARQMLVASLWADEAWAGAATYLKGEIDRVGEAPGLMYAYGRSLLEAGDLSGAVTALTQSLKLAGDDTNLRTNAEELRRKALDLGGTLIVPAEMTARTPVLSEEVDGALQEFAKFVAGAKRMRFWRPEGDDHKWVDRPEGFAQDLLHMYLKAHFKQRVSAYEEVAAGPGRLDLLLKLDGGLSVIIELKMCGYGYSSTYAASGEDQVRAYMEAHGAHLGYLVICDARLRDFGASLLAGLDTGLDTVRETFVDLRPRIAKRGAKG